MLLRGTRRRLRTDAARAAEQLSLPWLCPALQYDIARSRRLAASTAAPNVDRRTSSLPQSPFSRPQSPSIRPEFVRGRTYAAHATQADYFGHVTPGEEFIPFDSTTGSGLQSSSSASLPWSAQNESLYNIPYVDPQSPLIVPDSLWMGTRKFRQSNGVGGSLDDIYLIFRACLQLGQLERASVMVRRLSEIYRADSGELLDAHNAYLGGIVDKLAVSQDESLLDRMNRWLEVEMKAKGIVPNETTFAMLIRASFFCDNKKWVERSVRRLMEMAEQYGIYKEARLAVLSQLTNEETGRFLDCEPKIKQQKTTLDVAPVDEIKITKIIAEEATTPLQKAIQAQQQKGHGLTTLHESLRSLPSTYDLQSIAQADAIDPVKLQLQLEEDTVDSAIRRWRIENDEMAKNLGIHSGLHKKSVGALMWSWYDSLLTTIKHDIANEDSFQSTPDVGVDDDKSLFFLPLLQSVPAEKLAATTIICTVQALVRRDSTDMQQPMTRVVMAIGKAIESESIAESVKRSVPHHRKVRDMAKLVRLQKHHRSEQERNTSELLEDVLNPLPQWSGAAQLRVGVKLVSLLMKVAEVDVPTKGESTTREPAFIQSMEYTQGRKTGILGLHPNVAEKLRTEPVGTVIAKHLPMLTEPLPWTESRKGGYLTQPVAAVRYAHPSKQMAEYVKLASKKGDMKQVYAALDILGQTAWRINKGVFDVMVDVWNSGEAVAGIPPRDPKPDYPPNPGSNASTEDKQEYARKLRKIDNEIDGFHSNRCFQNFQLEVAKAFLGKKMYFPHNMDFRGRAYPIPPYLNHMGADNCRGLLQFDEGKELGTKGLVWLKVHLANLYGFDKASLSERENFAIDHLDDIRDSATNPLTGRKWWLKAEDPWQCLAVCIELSEALSLPDPTKFVSHQPVHQDGTCNGLQHYAALGGDPIGAKQVNLEPGDRPSDIYTAVAEMTAVSIAKDAAEGNKLARLLEGKITRKVVKQTVMTKVYGVTFSGARMQVVRRLDELYPDLFPDNRESLMAAGYIAKKIFGTLSIMFNGAQDIQLWLGECASRICDSLTEAQVNWLEKDEAAKQNDGPKQKSKFKASHVNTKSTINENTRFKSGVIWTSPLRMPVVQPYRDIDSKQIKTNLQAISLYEPTHADPVHKKKQLQGFPPNFIHSLDACHMFLTALKAKEERMNFAAVHDSFWTHACDIDKMNEIIRDSFIRMHSDNIIARLAAEFEARYKGSFYSAPVKMSTPLAHRIQKLRKASGKKGTSSREAHNRASIDELFLEKKRLQLLQSDDPVEREEGAAMMTPGRLFEEAEAEGATETKEQLEALFGPEETTDMLIAAKDAINGFDETVAIPSGSLGAAEADPEAQSTEAASKSTSEKPKKPKLLKPSNSSTVIHVWRPMSFPPMPERGTFDVSRLRDSKYFFS